MALQPGLLGIVQPWPIVSARPTDFIRKIGKRSRHQDCRERFSGLQEFVMKIPFKSSPVLRLRLAEPGFVALGIQLGAKLSSVGAVGTTMKREAMRPLGLAMGMLLIAAASSSAEQTSSKTDSSKATPLQSGYALAPARAKPEKALRNAGTASPALRQANQWSIKDALPDNTKAFAIGEPDSKTKPAIGRLPLRSGSVGFETDPKIKSMEYPDGQKVPGYEASGRQPPSYLGFSLSMPTSDKSMWPFSGSE
jgi:hypothetical protein